jgi:hypothetical protein
MKYQYQDSVTKKWIDVCKLQCANCKYTIPSTGRKCTRRVCIGLPYCFQHRKITLGVSIVDPSSNTHRLYNPARPPMGSGLFATRDLKIGTKIPYEGLMIDPHAPPSTGADRVYGMEGHNMKANAGCRRGIGSIANSVRGKPHGGGYWDSKRNAEQAWEWNKRADGTRDGTKRFVIKLTHNVKKDREIMIYYGPDYWKPPATPKVRTR